MSKGLITGPYVILGKLAPMTLCLKPLLHVKEVESTHPGMVNASKALDTYSILSAET